MRVLLIVCVCDLNCEDVLLTVCVGVLLTVYEGSFNCVCVLLTVYVFFICLCGCSFNCV